MGVKVKEIGTGSRGGRLIVIHCPGCKYDHPFEIECAGKGWTWNGSVEAPTFTPSLLINQDSPAHRCHMVVTNGRIKFQNDCFHELNGREVEVPDWED